MTEHHVLGLSGGKDSAALAVYMRQHHPELNIVLCLFNIEHQDQVEKLTTLFFSVGNILSTHMPTLE